MSMAGIGAVLLVSADRGSYAVAGIVSAVYSLPRRSSARRSPEDRRPRPARVVPIQLMVHVPAIAAIIVLTLATPLNWPIYLLAFVAGAAAAEHRTAGPGPLVEPC